LDVEIRLAVVAADDARILADDDELRVVRLELEHRAVDLDVGEVDVRPPDDADGDAGAVEAAANQRGGVVDGGEVARADEVRGAVGELRSAEGPLVRIEEVKLAQERIGRGVRGGDVITPRLRLLRRHRGGSSEVGLFEEIVERGDAGDDALQRRGNGDLRA